MLEFKGVVSVGFRCLFRLRETYTGVHGAGDSPFTCGKHPRRVVGPPDRPGSCTQCVGEIHLRRHGGPQHGGRVSMSTAGPKRIGGGLQRQSSNKKISSTSSLRKKESNYEYQKNLCKYEAYVFNLGIGLG